MREKIGAACYVAAAAAFICAAAAFGPRIVDYAKARAGYEDLRERYVTEDPARPEAGEGDEAATEGAAGSAADLGEAASEAGGAGASDGMDALVKLLAEIGAEGDLSAYAPIVVDHAALEERNPDYVGWLYVPGTDVSYPVVRGKDNDEYLHATIDRTYCYAGTIFMDWRCAGGFLDHHVVLYGHNMRDGSMLAATKSYLDPEWLAKRPVFWILTKDHALLYRVFSAFEASPSDADAFGTQGEGFRTNEEWAKAVAELKRKSAAKVDQDVDGTSFVVTLSTCTNARTTRVVTSGVLVGSVPTGAVGGE